jgi:hypothetical protein
MVAFPWKNTRNLNHDSRTPSEIRTVQLASMSEELPACASMQTPPLLTTALTFVSRYTHKANVECHTERMTCITHITGQGLIVNDLFSHYHLGHDLLAGIARRYHLKQEVNLKNYYIDR